jgi:hypothetical protein
MPSMHSLLHHDFVAAKASDAARAGRRARRAGSFLPPRASLKRVLPRRRKALRPATA